MLRILRKTFRIFLVIDVCLLSAVLLAEALSGSPELLIRIRNGLFTDFITDSEELNRPLSELVSEGFLVDPPELIARWRERIAAIPPYGDMLKRIEGMSSTVEKVSEIVRTFSRCGGTFFRAKANLEEKLREISKPLGVCSDHVEVFVALASVAGIDARETLTGGHNTAAFYSPELKKWVWIDPQYALLARDHSGRLLSSIELREEYLRGRPVELEYIGAPDTSCASKNPHELTPYRPEVMNTRFSIVWGNNVFTFDKYRNRLILLPKSGRQMLLLAVGLQPHTLMLDDELNPMWHYRARKVIVYTGLTVLLIGNFAYPVGLLLRWFARRLGLLGPPTDGASPAADAV